MNILLVNPPIRENRPAYFHPIGLASVAAVLRNAGHGVQILDLNCMRPKVEGVKDILPEGPFDWIGVSGLITTFRYLRFLVPLLRRTYHVPIVVGGGGITSAPEVYMETLHPDYGVVGEGEYTGLDICKVVAGEMAAKDAPGVVYLDDGKIAFAPPRELEKNLDNFPPPAFDLLDMNAYAEVVKHGYPTGRELAILATRGCPWHCAFCYHIFGRGVRYRSPQRVVDEMQFLMEKYGATSFLFGDECLTAKKAFVHEFCNEILKRGLKVEWMCYTRADTLDEETMALMVDAGCFQVGYGIESGSQHILDSMDKRIKVDTARDAILMARRHFRRVGSTMIFGAPEESDETIAETVEFLEGIRLHPSFFHLTAYPGTKFFEDHKDKILAQHGTLANFFSCLDDASLFSANLTRWTNDEYLVKRFNMLRRIKKPYIEKMLRDDREQDIREECVRMGGDFGHYRQLLASQPEAQ